MHLITTPGRLGFHRVDEASRVLDQVFESLSPSDQNEFERLRRPGLSTTLVSTDGERLKELMIRAANQLEAPGRSIAIQPPNEVGKQRQFEAFVVHTEPVLTSPEIQNAKGLKGRGVPQVEITLTPAGLEILSKVSAEVVGERLAIILDGTVVTTSMVQERIRTKTLTLTFGWADTTEDADLMARLWAFLIGLEPLPGKLTLLEERVPKL